MPVPPSADDATLFAPSAQTLEESLPLDAAEPLATGVLLANRWELLALLGVGGMGSVYRARDRELDETVAVKVLRRELSRAPGMLERFRREVKLARRVTHPNVARTFDIGEAGDLRFLTMELLDGGPLSRQGVLGKGWPLARLIPIATAICAGLCAAHAAGVVHRDLKPDNVILERSRRVVITDFGIARALGLEGGANETHGAVVGTPTYMAPEQVAHDAEIGPAADIYALGCMLYELVSGVAPWTGPTPLAVAAARLVGAPPDVRTVRPDAPEALAQLLLAMMDRQPTRRPASASEVAEALAAIVPVLGPSSPGSSSTSVLPSLTPRPDPSLASPTQWGVPKAVAVLPIENLGPEADAYLAAALTDDLADLLSGSPGLRVRPRAVAALAAEGRRDPRDVGRELGVQVVVTGDVRRRGESVVATVRLITVEDGFQLWAQRFTADARDFMKVGDDAAAAIAAALIARPMAKRDAPTDPDALDLYMRGRYLLARTSGSTLEALDVLTRAIERAPDDRRIRVLYATAAIRGFAIGALSHERAADAQQTIDELLRENPRDVEALFARAQLHFTRGEAMTAATDLRAAIEGGAEHAPSLALLGDLLLDLGDLRRARAALERAARIEPTFYAARMSMTRLAALEGDFFRCRAILGEPPDDPFDLGVYWVVRSRFAMWSGSHDEARSIRQAFVDRAPPSFLRDVADATTAAILELPLAGAAGPLARAANGFDPRAGQRTAAFHLQYRAEVLCVLGDAEAAMAAVAGADGAGAFDVLWIETCPVLAPVRRHPTFADVRGRMLARADRVRMALGEVAIPR